jgi:hypothetical protein
MTTPKQKRKAKLTAKQIRYREAYEQGVFDTLMDLVRAEFLTFADVDKFKKLKECL